MLPFSDSPGEKALQPLSYQRTSAKWREADSKYLLSDQFCLKCNVCGRAWTDRKVRCRIKATFIEDKGICTGNSC